MTETPTYTPADPKEIRPLPQHLPAVVREQVERDLGALREGERFALVAGIDQEGTRLAVLGRKPGSAWSFSGYLAKPWKGPLEVGAKVVIAF